MSLSRFLQRVAARLPETGDGTLAHRVLAEGGSMRIEDLGLDSLEMLDLMMGLEEDFQVELAIEDLTDRMCLEEVFAVIQRCRRDQDARGEGVA